MAAPTLESAMETDVGEEETGLPEEVLRMSTEELISRTRSVRKLFHFPI